MPENACAMPHPQNTPTLETERLRLRRFRSDDLDALLAIYGDEEANVFLPWYPVRSKEEARALFKERYARVYREPRGYAWAICLKSDDAPIGYVKVETDESHDLGYGLRKEFWHRGIATEAARAVLERLRMDGVPFVTATHDVNNPNSGRVMKNLGMRYRYSYEEQWQPKDVLVTFRLYQLNLDGDEARTFDKYWNASAVRFVEEGL